MIKNGAAAILWSMLIVPALAWGAVQLFDHESRISKNETLNTRLIKMEKQVEEIHKAVHGY